MNTESIGNWSGSSTCLFESQNTQQGSCCNCTVIVVFTCSSTKPDIIGIAFCAHIFKVFKWWKVTVKRAQHVQRILLLYICLKSHIDSVFFQTCESSFATKDRLRAHMIRHEEKVPCHICGKLLSAAYITDHMRVHNQSQHHACHLCNRSKHRCFDSFTLKRISSIF